MNENAEKSIDKTVTCNRNNSSVSRRFNFLTINVPANSPSKNKTVVADEAPRKEIFNPFTAFKLLRHPFILMSSIAAGLFFGAIFATEAYYLMNLVIHMV